MRDQRRHILGKAKWVKEALRDWFRRGKIDVRLGDQISDADLDRATRPPQEPHPASWDGSKGEGRFFKSIAAYFNF